MPLLGLFGPPDVKKLRANRDIQGLIKALGYQKDASICASAAVALGELRSTQAVEPLMAAFEDRHGSVHAAAVTALGQIGDARAVEPLIAALKGQYYKYKGRAATALGQIGDARAVEPLVAALKDGEENVRRDAVQALGQIGDARAVEPLIAATMDGDRHMREAVAKALGQIGASAVEPLIAALQSRYLYVRSAAATALGQSGDARAVEPLVAALEHWDVEDVRRAVAEALDKLKWQPDQGAAGAVYWITRFEWERCAQIGAPAVEPLITALQMLKEQSRNAAALGLGKIGDARAVEPLLAALKDALKNPLDPGVSLSAVEALGQIGDARAVEPLIALLRDGWVHRGTPAFMDPHDHRLWADLWEKGLRRAAARALGQIGDARAVEPLIAATKDEDSELRESAAEALRKLGR